MERCFWILSWKNDDETFSRSTALQRRGPNNLYMNGTGFGRPERLDSKSVSDAIMES